MFNVDSPESIASNGLRGINLELRLDVDINTCRLMASADNRDWVDASFTGITELLRGQRNLSWLVQTAWTGLFVQLLGLVFGFALSVWAAVKISPHLKIENPFAISFLFALLVFSNIWLYLNAQILRLINFSFPNLRFKRQGRDITHWLTQSVVGGVITAIALFVLNTFFDLIGNVLGTFLGK